MTLKKILLIAALIYTSTALHSQQFNSEGLIDYEFTHHYDTTNLSKVHNEILRLYFNSQLCVYRSLSRLQYDSAQHAAFQKNVAQNNTFNMNLGQLPNGSIEQFFTYPDKQVTLSYRKFLKVNYLVKDTTTISWAISQETSNILGYKCQKAKGTFKGRQYEAWFTTDIPYSIGPWKLKGLPGAILKATDSKGQVTFVAKNIRIGNAGYVIALPEKPVYTSQKELSKAMQAYRENPNGMQGDGSISIEAKTNSFSGKMIKANNPVELSD